MRRFMDVNIVECLKRVLDEITARHQKEFKFDIMQIYSEAQKAKDEGITRHLLWMARQNGTWCVLEANAYIRQAHENKIWCGYQYEPDGVRAFAVEITGVRDNTVVGNIYEIDYAEHIKQISQHLFDAHSVNIELRNGEKVNVSIDKFNYYKLQQECDTIKKTTYVLEDIQGHHEFLNGIRSLRATKQSSDMRFIDLLHNKTPLDVNLIIGGTDMRASFVWGEDSIITDYGIEKYKPLMESEYTLLDNGNIEIHCDNYKLGEEFCMAAAGYIGVTEYNKIFGEKDY